MGWLNKRSVAPAESNQLPQLLIRSLNSLNCESIIINSSGEIIFASPKIELLNLQSQGKISSDELMALVRVVRRTGSTQTGSIDVARGPIGESKRELQITATVISEDGLVLVVIDDEGEKQRVDAVRRDFITNISHELKTPIQALSLNADALLEVNTEPEKVLGFARKIKLQTNRLNDLVREIINLSKLQNTDPMIEAQEFEVSDLLTEAIAQCEFVAEARNVWIDLKVDKDAVVLGNREQLIMAVNNLIENAINYSAESTKVSVITNLDSEVIEIVVKDQGIGIAEENLDRIFERFYRVDPARSRATGGTGLGLSIVKHVVGNHGGEVKVWSVLGVGSTFAIRLPIAKDKLAV